LPPSATPNGQGIDQWDQNAFTTKHGLAKLPSRAAQAMGLKNSMRDLPVKVEIVRREILLLSRERNFRVGGFGIGCCGL
jgi:hypothetical protein